MNKSKKKTVHRSNAPDSEKFKMPLKVIRDDRLSYSAIGVYGCMACLRQIGEAPTLENLMRINPPGSEKEIEAAREELERFGHIHRDYFMVLRDVAQDPAFGPNAKGMLFSILTRPDLFNPPHGSLEAAHDGKLTEAPRNPE